MKMNSCVDKVFFNGSYKIRSPNRLEYKVLLLLISHSQPAFTCLKSTMEKQEQCVK